MSSPIEIIDYTLGQYCPSFADIQNPIEHCATTAITDINGNSLGNINMGGNIDGPIMALAIIDSSPFLDSKQDVVNNVFQIMIETLVCDCWEEEKSDDDLESISAWVDAVYNFYNDSGQRNVKSQVDDLGTSVITLEVTSKENSILQTLIILK